MTTLAALLRRGAALIAAGLALGLAGAHAAPAPPPTADAVQSEAREILVMLRIPPDHYRPNASYGGDYGDPFTINARRRLAERIALPAVNRGASAGNTWTGRGNPQIRKLG